jgi:hypothetical protein
LGGELLAVLAVFAAFAAVAVLVVLAGTDAFAALRGAGAPTKDS